MMLLTITMILQKNAHNFKYRLRLQGYGPESDIEYRAGEVPQCHEHIAAYRTAKDLNNRASHRTRLVPFGNEKEIKTGNEQ